MVELARCPCGEIPHSLGIISEQSTPKCDLVTGNCCSEWKIEFINNYHLTNSDQCMELAIAAWNKAPRAK